MSAVEGKYRVVTSEWGSLIKLAAEEVFQLMLNADLEAVEESPPVHAEITAVIGLAGQICGVFSIGCSSKAAVQMTSAMLGLAPGTPTQETWDAVGEICNMVAGNFKTKLQDVGDGCMLSVPTVVTGCDYAVRSLARGERIERLFGFQGEPISIAVEVEN